MSKLRVALLFSAILLATIPENTFAEAYVVSTHKIVPRRGPSEQSWRRSVRALQYQFKRLLRVVVHHTKRYGSPELIALQRTARSRPKSQRKIFHSRLDKIEKILKKMNRPERDKAIKNLQSRIFNLKARLGRV